MNEKNRYPPPWPDAELPTPRVVLRSFELTDDGWLLALPGGVEFVRPPAELHLRELRDVDPTSPEALSKVSEAVGEVVDAEVRSLGLTDRRMRPGLADRHAEVLADTCGDQLDLPAARWKSRPGGAVHVREVAVRVMIVRDLVEHVRLHLDGEPTAPVWQRAGFLNDDSLSAHDDAMAELLGTRARGDEKGEVVAWASFAEILNRGLYEFTPRLRTLSIESEPDMSDLVTAYGAACAQIFNDLRDRVPYRLCADETCGRLFRRQLGRSKGVNKPRASGVEFCTWAHARNQSRRERRREQRKERSD